MMESRLEERLDALAQSDLYPFHMPGHKRNGPGLFARDITEIDGFDNLHDPQGILREEMERAAAFYGVRSTHFLINGSTCGILSAISAAVPAGGSLLTGRRSHISVYHAAYLRRLQLFYTEEGEPPAQVQAVLVTSPSYEGCVSDIRAWAEYAHERGAVLIVDEAHGAHFSRHPMFPASAAEEGADLVIQSVHKTLPALTQCALLHNVSGRVSDARLEKYLRIYETSSPSYVLMSSMTEALHGMMDRGISFFDSYAERLSALRRKLTELKVLKLAGGADGVLTEDGEIPGFGAGTATDPGKLVILGGSRLTGAALYETLAGDYHLQPEMKAPGYVLLMTSVGDTQEGYDRLCRALFEIDRQLTAAAGESGSCGDGGRGNAADGNLPVPPREMTIAEAYDSASEEVPLACAEGRISAGFVIVYPPDSPLIVPGERFTGQAVRGIRDCRESGCTLTGLHGDLAVCVKHN